MAPKRETLTSLRAARQLRRARSLYLAGTALWAAAAVWAGWLQPGSRQMWVSVLLLTVFTGLLLTASMWLRRLQPTTRPTHHAAPRGAVSPTT
ncbi:hypothetical protein BGK67_01915 [Streptomyces subrutilus]|uniref:Uncharacterized protein n=1 Tax=Streptomyces subrutilus TaxID=36818 RepID=A0A1E5Q0W7_9ACTN|nr:hypothetical protein [Streptomyces subrutilus]OEJ35403.1 hypothetical protein BGK67_01915 [Streptomyces subrutilus]